jgi:beta-galactosidase
MKRKIFSLTLFLWILLVFSPGNGLMAQRLLFDSDWRFHRLGAMDAECPDFPDSSWRKVDLPHDWSIEDPL